MDSFDEIWQMILEYMKSQVTEVAYNVWLKPLEFVKFENDTVFLSITNFKKKVVEDKFTPLILKACEMTMGFPVNLQITASDSANNENKTNDSPTSNFSLNKYEYTFENFIIGSSNRFAHAAAMNVASNPGKAYNPLFIYGHSGLGKTHLLSAIKHEIEKNDPSADIIYTSGEYFTNELVNCLRNQSNYAFHEKYRSCDVLLIDDIQFIAAKEATQEEFFHTFNALTNSGKQVVLTSDRPPKEMLTLEERLRTRFESGLIADIQPPSLETRMAIINKKAEDLGIVLSEDVIDFLADNIKKNVRQLEGAVKKIKAYQDVENARPSVALAKRAIADIINDDQPIPMTIEKIMNEVSRSFNVNPADLKSDKRNANISQARQVAMYIVSEMTDMSLKAIGKEFGGKHYSTVIYSLNEIKDKLSQNVALKATVDDIIKNINEQ